MDEYGAITALHIATFINAHKNSSFKTDIVARISLQNKAIYYKMKVITCKCCHFKTY